ncbi:UNVERIFIED_CONTAM: hypothetical protein FKN15_025141 [Acipenser sinensis]
MAVGTSHNVPPSIMYTTSHKTGLLEDERMASAHQAETFTKQIQRLQAQLRSVQEEIDSLEEEKESELSEAQEELRVAQEEVLVLQQAAEEAAAERENDIASLQEELCRLRAELQRLHATRQEYELEITSLRAEIRMKSQGSAHDREEGEPLQGEVRTLRDECQSLKEKSQSLREDNKQLLRKLQHLSQNRESTNDLYLALKEGTLSSEGEKPSTGKKDLSGGTEEEGYECAGLLAELRELQGRYSTSQKERAELERELHKCREEMQQLTGKNAKKPQFYTGEVRTLRDECQSLKEKSQSLREDNKQLLRKLQHLSQNRESTNDLYLALKEGTLSSEGEKPSTGKKDLSGGTEEEGYECAGLLAELRELQGLYSTSQKERAELERELHKCREEMQQLTGKNAKEVT